MKIRPLILDEAADAEIKRVCDHAAVHRVSVADIFDVMGGRRPPFGDDPGFCCVVRVGYRCVYTIEQQSKHGWCRHLSISVLDDGYAPNEAAVLALMGKFGFKGGFNDLLACFTEDTAPGKVAINVLQQEKYELR